jgi:predicted transcriptional regulator
MSKIPPKKGKNVVKKVKMVKNDPKKGKIYNEIRQICKKNPKIKQKIKNIKDLDKKLYYARVWYVTEQQPLHILENFEKRGWKNHHLDHIFPIIESYNQNISPEKVGNIKNLRFIPYNENIEKGSKITNESKNALNRIKKIKPI